jgi:hypothetical protein
MLADGYSFMASVETQSICRGRTLRSWGQGVFNERNDRELCRPPWFRLGKSTDQHLCHVAAITGAEKPKGRQESKEEFQKNATEVFKS